MFFSNKAFKKAILFQTLQTIHVFSGIQQDQIVFLATDTYCLCMLKGMDTVSRLHQFDQVLASFVRRVIYHIHTGFIQCDRVSVFLLLTCTYITYIFTQITVLL